MPRPRFEKLSEEKKAAILDAATEAFASAGFHGASYNQIIEAAGISKGAMYYYFDDKEDLFATVVDRSLHGVVDALGSFPEVEGIDAFWRALDDFMDQMLDLSLRAPHAFALMRHVLKLDAEGGIKKPILREIRQMNLDWSRHFLKAGQGVGAVRDDLPLDFLVRILGALDEAGDLWFVEQYETIDAQAMKTYGKILTDLIRRLVAPEVSFTPGS
ncbi:MAG: TetR/AcrR family transcriptional regulator [Deltaproteobacteria bacterium]|nr:TetR/AcrR family transcriptional regulator [Deltaproteobacteria bacterium]